MSNSYGVDANKGAANVSNPYDFKNVQVSLFYLNVLNYVLIAKTTTFFISKQRWTV
jgi:hypothetical protein